LIHSGIPFDNSSLLLQRQVESVAMTCFVGIASVVAIRTIFFFIIEALVGDRQWHSFCKSGAAVVVCM
jgi:hypothetical protein